MMKKHMGIKSMIPDSNFSICKVLIKRAGKLLYGIGLLLSSLSLSSCFLNSPPLDIYSDPAAIKNTRAARELLTSIYLLYPHYEYEFSILGGDLCPTNLSVKDVSKRNLYYWKVKEIMQMSQYMYLEYYNTIANCDLLLERIPFVVTEKPADEKERDLILGQTLTMKALCYFNLLKIFATPYDLDPEAPGIVLKNYIGLEELERSSIRESVEYIRSLLNQALPLLDGVVEESCIWLSKNAVTFILADLELYAGNYKRATEYAQELIAQADVDALKDYSLLWRNNTGNQKSRIFAFDNNLSFYVAIEYDKDDGDYFYLSPDIEYGTSDKRKEYSVVLKNMDGIDRNLLGKYNKLNKENKNIDLLNCFSFSAAYYIAAEAYWHLNKDTQARDILNLYLSYLNAEAIASGLSHAELLEVIIKEKRKEFVGEGISFFDFKRLHNKELKRYNNWGGKVIETIKTDSYIWTFPIPLGEYRNNPNVVQNSGWPVIGRD